MTTSSIPRIIALDLGDASIGIAISDALGISAQPYENYRRSSKKRDIDYIVDLAAEKGARIVLLGMPLRLDGSEGEQAAKTKSFISALEKKLAYTDKLSHKVEVKTIDERYTSSGADAIMKQAGLSRKDRSKSIDMLAATLMLQTFMQMNGGN